MTLGFTTKIAGEPNFFVEKILRTVCPTLQDYDKYIKAYYDRFPAALDQLVLKKEILIHLRPKLHTLRNDALDRWQDGRPIQAVVCNRTKNRYQFAPAFKCVSVQLLRIVAAEQRVLVLEKHAYRELGFDAIGALAINDGFHNAAAFFDYFKDEHSNLKLIHFTDLKY